MSMGPLAIPADPCGTPCTARGCENRIHPHAITPKLLRRNPVRENAATALRRARLQHA